MQRNNPPIYLPDLGEVIDRYPLIVTSQTPLLEVIALMGQLRSSCPLGEFSPAAGVGTIPASPLLGEARASCVLAIDPKGSRSQLGSPIQGIFTERDIVTLIASGQNLKQFTISEVMTQPVIALTESEVQDVFTVLILLRQHRIRHLPILDDAGNLLGVVTPESIRQAMLQPANLLKMRRVEEVMTSDVIQAPATASVMSLARVMTEHRVSCVVIVEPSAESGGADEKSPPSAPMPVGMVTERDIVQFQALELDLCQLQAQTVMSTPLFCLSPQDSLWEAHQQMQQRYVRRLVVAGSRGEVLGIVTQSSLLRVLDPMEMSGIIDALHLAVEQRTKELQKAVAQLESEIAVRERVQSRLRLLESAVINANDAIVIMDAGQEDASDPNIVYVNEAFSQMSGYTPEEIAGKTPSCLRGPKSDPEQVAKIRRALSRREPVRVELINYRKDGTEYWVELNSVPVTDVQGNLTHWVSVQRDITERKRMEQALFEEKELAQVTLQSIGDGVIATDAGARISELNPAAERLTGWKASVAKGLPLTKVFRIVSETTRVPVENTAETALRENRVVDMVNHCVLIARSGHEFAIDHTAAPIHASDGRIVGAVLVFRDVTQVRSQARQLSWQATHDSLTGLINRREFGSQLEAAVASAKSDSQQHILLYLDLDKFKVVNDTSGHIAGDELLRQVTALFKSRVRKTDILARLGGDEFAVLLYQCPEEIGLQIAESLLHSVGAFRFVWQDKTFSIGVSIGLVTIDASTQSASAVLNAADAACYAAKDGGRHRVHISCACSGEEGQPCGGTQWPVRINRALQENRFRLYCQPAVPIAHPHSHRHYCEILLRLEDEKGQLVSPMAFIPAAERYGIMQAIDRWVICTLFSSLANSGLGISESQFNLKYKIETFPSLYAINLSVASLNDERFIDFLCEQFSTSRISPQLVCFEIAETVAVANMSRAAELIGALKELGCRIAIDDFGSGMSSFAYLKTLPVDFIKIDGNLVKNIALCPIDFALVEAINKIARALGIKTIAEFVESEAIVENLNKIGVDYAQGYAIAPPQPAHLMLGSQGRIVEVVQGTADDNPLERQVASPAYRVSVPPVAGAGL
ncbi:EAL domain-containing protein [Kamptonema formosum]|uniref:EAL domain-containing protein n=1 Tax=Kamptonema formosum TaxID=331992 RepID=UPI000375165C|nr:EAL domain-containing protein [Oscillatoria sp. PCC 10802]